MISTSSAGKTSGDKAMGYKAMGLLVDTRSNHYNSSMNIYIDWTIYVIVLFWYGRSCTDQVVS